MEAKDCEHYLPPRLVIDPKTGDGHRTSAMCKLVDKYCILEHKKDCVCYLKEEE